MPRRKNTEKNIVDKKVEEKNIEDFKEKANLDVRVIEDESECNTVFARARVSFTCEANMMSMFKQMDFNASYPFN